MESVITSPKMLGHQLKRFRKKKKLSQTAAGQPFCLEQSTISSIEQGANGTRLDTLFRLLAALDIEMVIRDKSHSPLVVTKEDW